MCVRLILLFAMTCHCSYVFGEVEFDWATVGNPGNEPDRTSSRPPKFYGGVDYEFRISKHEVTNEQYAEFLANVALDDPYELFHPGMRIRRTGTSGGYSYSVTPRYAKHPVTHIRFFDAMRFVNWLENGQNEGDIERGTYTIGTGVSETRAELANYFIPTDEEWYKAAFYDPTLADGAGGYWKYATQSNNFPTFERPAGGTNSVNTAESKVGGTTEVGAYANSTSYYGTFDQTGNVGEWTETIVQSGDLPAGRRKRLPSWGDSVFFLSSAGATLAGRYDRAAAAPYTGFRVARRAMIPGDFDDDGTLAVDDIDALTAAILFQSNESRYDLNSDGNINRTDRSYWVKSLANTWFGDADLDGEFNSSDFTKVFQAGKYESAELARWNEGDWNGDGRFDSSDFVTAFGDDGYEKGVRTGAATVPEPSGLILAVLGFMGILNRTR